MKYGVLYFKNTLNLGDDVQTYASLKYLPKIDYYIDRENMDSFVPNEKEQIAVISNGWFVHKSLNFPPSPYILPLPISMHFSLKHVEDIQNEFFHLNNDFSLRYLKSIEPIMCRDSYTADLLRNKGIKSEYSGCMTLTIKKFDDVQKGEYICDERLLAPLCPR